MPSVCQGLDHDSRGDISSLVGRAGRGWYHDPVHVKAVNADGSTRSVRGTLRSMRCHRANANGKPMTDGACRSCSALGKDESVRSALTNGKRRAYTQDCDPAEGRNHGYWDRASIEAKLKERAREVSELKAALLTHEKAATRERISNEISNTDAKVASASLLEADKSGKLNGGQFGAALSILSQCATNMLTNDKRGRRHSLHEAAMMFHEILLYDGGPTLQRFAATNLNGPLHKLTIERNLRQLPEFAHGMEGSRRMFKAVAGVYKEAMEALGLPLGSVLSEMSEDETNTLDVVEYNPKTDCLDNLCGWKNGEHQ